MKNLLKSALFAVFALSLFACGGGGSDLSGKYSVNDVNILANDIEVGERVRVEVFFETKVEVDGFPDGVQVVVRVPAELRYVPGSSAIYDGSTRNTDARTPDDVVNCATGETFLLYDFDDSELFDRAISGSNNFGLRFEAEGVTPVAVTRVGASAGEREDFACGENFRAEQDEAVEVLP